MFLELRALLTGRPLSYAERWLVAQAPLSLEWQIMHKEAK